MSSDRREHLRRPHRFRDIVFKKRAGKRDVITRRAFGREGVQQLGNESSRLLLVSQHPKLMLYDHASNLFLQLPGVSLPPLPLFLSIHFVRRQLWLQSKIGVSTYLRSAKKVLPCGTREYQQTTLDRKLYRYQSLFPLLSTQNGGK